MGLKDGEHEDKYNKPWELWAHEKCRECAHVKYMHLLVTPDALNNSGGIVGACNTLAVGGGFCSCKEYMPPDNLDYIELLAKRKGIIQDEKDKS